MQNRRMIVNSGSVDDVMCSLKTSSKLTKDQISQEIEYEKSHKNRSTILKKLESMKKAAILTVALVLLIASCQKDPCSQPPVYDLQSDLQGHYQQVGFKSSLFPSWSYTTSGPQFDIIGDSITGIYATKYEVLNNKTILLADPNELVKITFGDTVVFAFQNGDSTKMIKY